MLEVINKVRSGNTVIYECNDEQNGKYGLTFDKDSLIREIKAGNVKNARIQDYKGQLIIRIKDTTGTIQKQTRQRSKTILALDLFKDIVRDFGIKHEEEALAVGFDRYELDEEINTKNEEYVTKLQYKMASDIKKIADLESRNTLASYRMKYEQTFGGNI